MYSVAQRYNFKNYTVEDGLAQSQINDINQDSQGYLWIGTESGLSRFDGLNFVNFSIDDGLPDNKVEKIYFHKNECWIATPSGLAKFTDDRFIPYLFDEPERVNDVKYFQGKIYVASNSGLMVLEDGIYTKIPFEDESSLTIRTIINVNDEYLYCGSRNGLYKWDGSFELTENKVLQTANISDLEIINDQLLISTYGDGLVRYNPEADSLFIYDLEISRIRSFFADEEVILCSSIKGGIEITDSEVTYYNKNNGLINESLVCIFKDHEGNFWMGTDGNGLLKFLGKSVISYSTDDGLGSNIVMSICQATDHSFIFGTYNAGISIFDQDQRIQIKEENGLKDNTVWEIIRASNEGYWVATSSGVNYLLDSKIQSHPATDQINSKIRSIATFESTVFFGGTDGLYYYDGTFTQHLENTSEININDLCVKDDTLFIASQTGLFFLPASNFSATPDKIDLNEENINCLHIDSRQFMWIGTMNGLFVRLKSGEIVPFPLDIEDFNSKTILGLLESNSGDIWISTMSGVYQIRSEEKEGLNYKLTHYSTSEGLMNLESNLNAIYEDLEHNIWIGTSNGLARINPKYYDQLFALQPPELQITGIRLFMEEFDYKRFKSEFKENNPIPSSISLPYNQNHITFDFIGINLKNPGSVKYEYRLLGSNSSWSPLSKSNYASYSDLAPGEYDFEVRATNKSYVWSSTKGVHIIIRSPFWKTWWFITLMVAFIMVIMLLIFQSRIRSIKQKQENEKLNYKNRLLFLEQQSLNASMNRHFIFNSLNSIQYFINSSDKLSANKYLSSFAKLIRKNLDSSTANNFIVTLQEEIERIELYLTLEKMRFREKFDYKLNVSSGLDTESIEIPSMILQPFVENSIIHGVLPLERKGHIDINIFEEIDEVVFEVVDDGIGIETTLNKKKDNLAGDHESKGMEITNRRIELLRKLTGDNLMIIGPYQLNDGNGNCKGTKVVIRMGIHLEK